MIPGVNGLNKQMGHAQERGKTLLIYLLYTNAQYYILLLAAVTGCQVGGLPEL